MKLQIILLFFFSINLALSQSIILEKTDFRLIKGDIQFDGENLFKMLIQEKLFPSDHKGYLPGDKVGEYECLGQKWYGSNGTGLVCRNSETGKYTIYNFPDAFIPGNHLRIAYGDDQYLFFTLGDFATIGRYGGILVMDLRSQKFARISQIATKDGAFGYFSFEDLRKHRSDSMPPQMGWDYRNLKDAEYATIASGYDLRFPSSIQRQGNHFTMSFNEDWKIESFTTRLHFESEDLEKWFNSDHSPE